MNYVTIFVILLVIAVFSVLGVRFYFLYRMGKEEVEKIEERKKI